MGGSFQSRYKVKGYYGFLFRDVTRISDISWNNKIDFFEVSDDEYNLSLYYIIYIFNWHLSMT